MEKDLWEIAQVLKEVGFTVETVVDRAPADEGSGYVTVSMIIETTRPFPWKYLVRHLVRQPYSEREHWTRRRR